MIIKRGEMVQYHARTRSKEDRRKFVSKSVFAYWAPNGDEYRRSFELAVTATEEGHVKHAPKELIVPVSSSNDFNQLSR